MVKIKITWSDGTQTIESGGEPCINAPAMTPDRLYNLFCMMAAYCRGQPQPVNYEVIN